MLFVYRWEDGDVTIVDARDKEEAWGLLDELGGPDVERIERIRMRDFLINFKVKDGRFEFGDQQGECFEEWMDELIARPPVEEEKAQKLVEEYHMTLPDMKALLKRRWMATHRAFQAFIGASARNDPKKDAEVRDAMFAKIDALTEADLERGQEEIAQELAGTVHAAALARRSHEEPSARRAAASRRNGRRGGRPKKPAVKEGGE